MVWKAIAVAALAALMLVSPASAATISVSPATFDFGSVAVGDTVSHQFAVHTESSGQPFVGVGPLLAGLDPAFSVPKADNTCFGYGDCTITVYFSPTVAGLVSSDLTLLLIATTVVGNFPVASFSVALSGIGVAPSEVPLPGALVLFASGLGLAGLFGWRRRRQATAA